MVKVNLFPETILMKVSFNLEKPMEGGKPAIQMELIMKGAFPRTLKMATGNYMNLMELVIKEIGEKESKQIYFYLIILLF